MVPATNKTFIFFQNHRMVMNLQKLIFFVYFAKLCWESVTYPYCSVYIFNNKNNTNTLLNVLFESLEHVSLLYHMTGLNTI